jgi:DNA-binding transcriptional regulator PaaX
MITELEKYSKPWILAKAKTGLPIHKYSYSHEKLRKKARRLCKDGLLVMEKQDKEKFYYKLAEL